MAKKKKKVKKKTKRKPDINIQVRNLDKAIRASKNKKKTGCGICGGHGGHFWIFGSALAIVLSYTKSASILYAILHGILSWFYVLFRAMQLWGWF